MFSLYPIVIKKLIYIVFLFCAFQGLSQSLTAKEQREIDRLNAIISATNSHDTALASAYVKLSEILYVSNPDTLKYAV